MKAGKSIIVLGVEPETFPLGGVGIGLSEFGCIVAFKTVSDNLLVVVVGGDVEN